MSCAFSPLHRRCLTRRGGTGAARRGGGLSVGEARAQLLTHGESRWQVGAASPAPRGEDERAASERER